MNRRLISALVCVVLLGLLGYRQLLSQQQPGVLIQGENSGVLIPGASRQTGVFRVNCTGATWNSATSTWTCPASAGPSGTAGPSGLSGTPGLSGASGLGLSGLSGVQGLSGLTGIQGSAGLSGATGVAGPSGQSGAQGVAGLTGISGIQGVTGATGLTGVQGLTGISGVAGPTGLTGVQGISGLAGISGVAGSAGSSGASGLSGAQGISGIAGTGASGLSGIAGPSGLSGKSGIAGASGLSGQSGIQGTAGATGLTGVQGLSGLSGQSGIAGTAGASGLSGTQGSSGVAGGTSAALANVVAVTATANTTSDQTLQEVALPSGFLNVASAVFLAHGSGIMTIAALQTPTLTFKVKLCTVSGCGSGSVTTLASLVTAATVSATNNPWNINLKIATVTTGASGTLLVHGPLLIDIGAVATLADTVYNDTNTAASGATALNGVLYLDFTVATSAGNAGNSFTQQIETLEPGSSTGATGLSGLQGLSGLSGASTGPTTSPIGAIIAGYSGSSGGAIRYPFSNVTTSVCSGSVIGGFWPSQGFFANFFANMTTTNASSGSGNPIGTVTHTCPLNGSATVPSPGNGLIIPPNAVAGGYVDNSAAFNYQRVTQWAAVGISLQKYGSGNTYGSSALIGAAFFADAGSPPGILGAFSGSATTASSTAYIGFGQTAAAPNATQLNVAIPLPFNLTFNTLSYSWATSPTAAVTVTLADNNAGGGLTGLTVTQPAASVTPGGMIDSTHTYAASAGDYVSTQIVSGATTQTVPGNVLIGYTPGTSGDQMIYGIINGTVTTTQTYSQPLYGLTSTAVLGVQLPMPQACTATNLYVVQATANAGGVTTTFALYKNGVAQALTGTITSGSGTGAVLLDNTHSVSLAQTDLVSIGYVTGSGTSGTIGGWAFKCR